MALISLGSVTIVAMILWFLVCVIGAVRPVKHAKMGIAASYVISVAWAFGVVV